jgi:hypothetical protein
MPIITRQPGLAPACSFVDGLLYVAYGIDPGALVLDVFTPQGALVRSTTLDGGFFDSFPVFGGRWLAYKRTADWRAVAVNVVNGETATFGEADGNWPIVVNDALGLVAWQQGRGYAIWLGSLITADAHQNGQAGAPDGLSVLTDGGEVVCRKDVRMSVPGMFYPVSAGDLTVGERPEGGVAVQFAGGALRVAFAGQDTPTPSCATDGMLYAIVTGGPQGVRVLVATAAELAGLPTSAPSPTPVPQPAPPPTPEDPPVNPKITVKQFGKTLAKGQPWQVNATIGDTDVTVRIGSDGNLTIHAKNPAGEDQTGAPRHVEVRG